MSVNFNELTKPFSAALVSGGAAAAALLADPTFLCTVPAWVKPILVVIVAFSSFAAVYSTPQAATASQITKAGADAAAVIAKAVVPVVAARTAEAAKTAVQNQVSDVVDQLPQPVQEIVEPVVEIAGDTVDQVINKFRVGV